MAVPWPPGRWIGGHLNLVVYIHSTCDDQEALDWTSMLQSQSRGLVGTSLSSVSRPGRPVSVGPTTWKRTSSGGRDSTNAKILFQPVQHPLVGCCSSHTIFKAWLK